MSDRKTAEYWNPIYDDDRDWRPVCDAEISSGSPSSSSPANHSPWTWRAGY
ncbi:hypothetical protein ABZT27_28635 [Streptomyces sp. NPDC005389]|uniref:hypothetical protein n=1 Tax=Streptomyces sp. NPDC005389 TaxID=3157040 RepID=UPI0033B61015